MTLKIPVRTLLLLALSVASCERAAQSLPREESVLRLQAPVSELQSKTWIDAASAGAVAPVYWSAGDRISVNGVTSSALEAADGARLTSASFYLRNVVAPYTVIYPSSAFAGTGENESLLLDIPATQAWKAGSFCEGSALLYGYSASEETPVQMQNLCGAITFTLKDASERKATSLSITSLTEGKPIAGRFSLNPATGLTLSPAGDNSARIEMVFPEEGLAIASAGTSFFFSIPAGDYPDGFLIRLDDEKKHILRSYWLRPAEGAAAGVTLEAGKLVVFSARDYDPDAREICSGADWEEFATAYNAGGDGWKAEWLGKDGSIRIGADFTAQTLTRINALSDILDGCGHTVTVTAATTPLVKTLTGTIKNLTLAGSNTPSDPSTAGATVFVTTLSGGVIENCVNKVALRLDNVDSAVIAGPFVRTFSGGRLVGCVNEGDLTVSSDFSTLSSSYRYFLGGGLVGLVKSLSGEALIQNCINKGNVSFTANKPADKAVAPVQAGYGGIVGTIIAGTAESFIRLENCENTGNIAVDYNPVPTNPTKITVTAAGGLVGTAMKYNGSAYNFNWLGTSSTPIAASQDGVYFEMKDCRTTGNVHNGICSKIAHGDATMNYAAGLIGIVNGLKDKPALIENCTVSGATVEAAPASNYSREAFCMVSGGLAGFAGYAHFKGCTVSGCKIGSIKRKSYAVSGGIGMAPLTFTMENCRIFADLYQIRATTYTEGNYAMGFVLSTKKGPTGTIESATAGLGGARDAMVNLEGSAVTGCSFGGTITYNTNPVTYSSTSGFTPQKTETLTASNFAGFIPCGMFTVDYYGRGIPGMVTISNNSYWNGQ